MSSSIGTKSNSLEKYHMLLAWQASVRIFSSLLCLLSQNPNSYRDAIAFVDRMCSSKHVPVCVDDDRQPKFKFTLIPHTYTQLNIFLPVINHTQTLFPQRQTCVSYLCIFSVAFVWSSVVSSNIEIYIYFQRFERKILSLKL